MPIMYNAQMASKQIREFCKLDFPSVDALRHNVNELGLSARAHDKVLRLARTIADLDAATDNITLDHLNEAINYRMLDRNKWQ